MGYFFIDESIHDAAEFIVVACVYSEVGLNDTIDAVITSCGFDSNEFEFKSSNIFAGDHARARLRDHLKTILNTRCKLAAVVMPRNKREEIGSECIRALKQFIEVNTTIEKPVHVYFDQGMFSGKQKNALAHVDNYFKAHVEQNSKLVKGLQLADLAAHLLSVQLKDGLGFITKKVKADENSGYDPDSEISLAFELWATTRYVFFNEGTVELSEDPIAMATVLVEPFGLYVSEYCDDLLAQTARQKFAKMYLGCIH